jgi:four helix bundle protein
MAFKFEKLEVWQKALRLSVEIHNLTKSFPREELYILTCQIKRAADSVALNIAEGSTGQTNAEFKMYIGYSIRSAIEVVACLHIGSQRELINKSDFDRIYNFTETLVKQLQAFRRSIK